jgi:hypothetical protein
MISFQPVHAFLDGKALDHGLFEGSEAGQGRQAAIRRGAIHDKSKYLEI